MSISTVPGKQKPSNLLLHYSYGTAAVERWGRSKKILQNRANPPSPPEAVPAPMGLSSKHDKRIAIRKRDATQDANAETAETGEPAESEGEAEWDPYDIMLFFWGDSPAAKQRRLKKAQEDTQRMEQLEWSEGVARVSV